MTYAISYPMPCYDYFVAVIMINTVENECKIYLARERQSSDWRSWNSLRCERGFLSIKIGHRVRKRPFGTRPEVSRLSTSRLYSPLLLFPPSPHRFPLLRIRSQTEERPGSG